MLLHGGVQCGACGGGARLGVSRDPILFTRSPYIDYRLACVLAALNQKIWDGTFQPKCGDSVSSKETPAALPLNDKHMDAS